MILPGYSSIDSRRVISVLKRLSPYLRQGEYCHVGGLAIRWHIASAGLTPPSRPFNDLDVVAKSLTSVSPASTSEFLIAHTHHNSPQEGQGFYIVPIDPVTKVKIDIFPWSRDPGQPQIITIEGMKIPIQDAEHQLVATIEDARKPLEGGVIDPKHFSDGDLLMRVADSAKAEAIWSARYPGSASLREAFAEAKAAAASHPELVRSKPYRRPHAYRCSNCVDVPGFPLTPMEEAYRALGYIE